LPTIAKDAVLKKWPPTISIASEWDPFIVGNERFAKRLAQNGRLLESIVYPGVNHGFMYDHSVATTKNYWQDLKLAVETYVLK